MGNRGTCSTCGGSGRAVYNSDWGERVRDCPTCRGGGSIEVQEYQEASRWQYTDYKEDITAPSDLYSRSSPKVRSPKFLPSQCKWLYREFRSFEETSKSLSAQLSEDPFNTNLQDQMYELERKKITSRIKAEKYLVEGIEHGDLEYPEKMGDKNPKEYLHDSISYWKKILKNYDKEFKKFLDRKQSYFWTRKGFELQKSQNIDEAIRCYDNALELDPSNVQAWNDKGWMFMRRKEYDKALQFLDRAIRIDPNYSYSWYNKGVSLRNLGKTDEAIRCYDKALAISPTATTYSDKAHAIISSGKNLEVANSALDLALKIDPTHPMANYNKACVLSLLGNVDDSLKFLEKAITLSDKYREMAKHDKDFASLWDTYKFLSVVDK